MADDPMNSSVFSPPQEVRVPVKITVHHLKTVKIAGFTWKDRISAFPYRIYDDSIMAWTQLKTETIYYSPAALLEHHQSGI
jgi:hypothetical protein